jgi:hypothetical protein
MEFKFSFNKNKEAIAPVISLKNEGAKLGSQQSFTKLVTAPKPVESAKYDWVLNGVNNSFPKELIELKNNSGIHSAILESSTRMIVGTGIQYDLDLAKSDSIYNTLDPVIKEKLKRLLSELNPNLNLNQIMYNVIRDYNTYGYCFIEAIWNMDHSAPIRLNYIDASKIAIGKKDENDEITHFYYSKNWTDTKVTPIRIGKFDPNKKDEGNQLIFINRYSQGNEYYGLPAYYSAVKWIQCDGSLASTNLNSVENGFSPNVLIKYFVDPSETQKADLVSSFKRSMTGVGQKLLFLFWPDKENAPEIEPLNIENFNDRMIGLNDMIVQQIISAHRIHPALASIQTPGKLGYSNELISAYKIYFESVIRPEREIFESILTKIFRMNGIPVDVYFNTPELITQPETSKKFTIKEIE